MVDFLSLTSDLKVQYARVGLEIKFRTSLELLLAIFL